MLTILWEVSPPSGIGGVLRDELGMVKGIFLKVVGVMDSIQAKLLDILEALMVFVESIFYLSLFDYWKWF